MTDIRLVMVASCVQALNELVNTGEVTALSADLSDPESIVFTVGLREPDEIIVELFMESSDYPLDVAVTVFDRVQDYLAENGPTRAEARPRCRPGHAHPAMFHRRESSLVLVCPEDLTILRLVSSLDGEAEGQP
ncbi:MAG: hypothetical protein M3Y42_05060 [Actinomycetota bacterium]|nr:hypothetical protein [Actinomycetota bacterium]